MDCVREVIEMIMNNSLMGVLLGGLIGLITQRFTAKASARTQISMLAMQEKIQRYYSVTDLLADLNEALNDLAASTIKMDEEVDEEERALRDQQGVNAIETIFKSFGQIERESNKIAVIGGKDVVVQMQKMKEVSQEYMQKLHDNAVDENGFFDAKLHREYKEKIESASKQVVDAMNAELSM